MRATQDRVQGFLDFDRASSSSYLAKNIAASATALRALVQWTSELPQTCAGPHIFRPGNKQAAHHLKTRLMMSHQKGVGVGDGNRTRNVRSHSPVLCQVELLPPRLLIIQLARATVRMRLKGSFAISQLKTSLKKLCFLADLDVMGVDRLPEMTIY
jgi:hypothetical protein